MYSGDTVQILVSPAPAGGSIGWFDPFFEACEALGCRIDYLATHDYPEYYPGTVDNVMNKLERLYERYGKKIWLTEFALCCTRDEEAVVQFVQEIVPRLEEADYIYKYSWFITRYNEDQVTLTGGRDDWYLDSVNSLLVGDSQELSRVGKLYNNL